MSPCDQQPHPEEPGEGHGGLRTSSCSGRRRSETASEAASEPCGSRRSLQPSEWRAEGATGVPLLQSREGAGAPWPLVSSERSAPRTCRPCPDEGGLGDSGQQGRRKSSSQKPVPGGCGLGQAGRAGRGAGPGRERPRLHLRKQPCRVARGRADRTFREPWGKGSQSRLRGARGTQTSRPGRQRPWAAREGDRPPCLCASWQEGLVLWAGAGLGACAGQGQAGLRPSRRCPRGAARPPLHGTPQGPRSR